MNVGHLFGPGKPKLNASSVDVPEKRAIFGVNCAVSFDGDLSLSIASILWRSAFACASVSAIVTFLRVVGSDEWKVTSLHSPKKERIAKFSTIVTLVSGRVALGSRNVPWDPTLPSQGCMFAWLFSEREVPFVETINNNTTSLVNSPCPRGKSLPVLLSPTYTFSQSPIYHPSPRLASG